MRIVRLNERFKINLGEVTVTIAPLSGRQKMEMTSLIKQDEKGRFIIDKPAQELFLVKHSVKEVSGIKDMDDKDYSLAFEGESLTDSCAEELLGFLVNTFFTVANTQAMGGLFGKVINPYTGKEIKGVEVERLVKAEDEKK